MAIVFLSKQLFLFMIGKTHENFVGLLFVLVLIIKIQIIIGDFHNYT